MKHLILIFLPCFAIGFGIGALLPKLIHAQTATHWFTVTLGETTCSADKLVHTPNQLSIRCTNPYGTMAGYYTASPNLAPNVFTISLSALAPVANPSSVTCLIGMNSTPNSLTLGSLGLVPANSAAYNCGGFQGGVISFP